MSYLVLRQKTIELSHEFFAPLQQANLPLAAKFRADVVELRGDPMQEARGDRIYQALHLVNVCVSHGGGAQEGRGGKLH